MSVKQEATPEEQGRYWKLKAREHVESEWKTRLEYAVGAVEGGTESAKDVLQWLRGIANEQHAKRQFEAEMFQLETFPGKRFKVFDPYDVHAAIDPDIEPLDV